MSAIRPLDATQAELIDLGMWKQAAHVAEVQRKLQELVLCAHAARNALSRNQQMTERLDAALEAFGVLRLSTAPAGPQILKGNADLLPPGGAL